MQNSKLSLQSKFKILVILAMISIGISIPLGFEKIEYETTGYYVIHLVSVILGSFLAVVGILSYLEFKRTRLLLIFSAFLAITIGEGTSLVGMIFPIFEVSYGLHSLITHGIILLMLSFFVVGIFRSD